MPGLEFIHKHHVVRSDFLNSVGWSVFERGTDHVSVFIHVNACNFQLLPFDGEFITNHKAAIFICAKIHMPGCNWHVAALGCFVEVLELLEL